MANDITSWSTTPANNTTFDGMTMAEGMAASAANNTMRQMSASLKAFYLDVAGGTSATGTANAITLTANVGFTTLADNRVVIFKASNTNTNATTINVNALGTKQIRRMTTAGDVALSGGEIQDNGVYILHYSADANSAAGAWLIANPTLDGAGTFTPTIVGSGSAGVGTYSTQDGSYIRQGNLVWFSLTVVWSNHTGTGDIQVGGLPIAPSNTKNYVFPVSANQLIGATTPVAVWNGTVLRIINSTSSAGISIDTAATVVITGIYSV